MAEKMIRVRNVMRYNIGVKLLSGAERNIAPGSFTMLSEEDIEYINSQSVPHKRPFTTGRLVVETDTETKEALDVVLETGAHGVEMFATQPEIETKLKSSNAKALRGWLSEIKSQDFLFEIYEAAKGMDLPASKVKVIHEFIPYAELVDEE